MSDFVVAIRPRYGEVDRMGFVYHAHYFVYFEIGRTEYLRSRGCTYSAVEDAGYRLVVAETRARFVSPAHYDEPLALAVRLERVGGASVIFGYTLRDEHGRLLAEGFTRLGCVDRDARPCRLPGELAEALSAGSPAHSAPSEGP